jgi:PAS domain S-box-containing protein
MNKSYKTREQLLNELQELRSRSAETEETLRAILAGEVDGLVIHTAEGDHVFTLSGADQPYRVMVETMSEGAATLAADRTILFCNQHFVDIVRGSLEKVIGTSIYRYISPSDLQRFDTLIEQGLKGDSKMELTLTTGGGNFTPVLLSISPLDHKGTPGAICLIVTDLTEQKRNEEILAEEKLTTQILKQTAELLVLCDHHGQIIRANRSSERLLGKSPILQLFDKAFNLLHPDGTPFVLLSRMDGKPLHSVEVNFRDNNNKSFSFLLSANSFISKKGFNGIVVVMVDITERKRIDEALRESETRFRTVLDNSLDVIYRLNLQSDRFDYISPSAEKVMGYSVDELMGLDGEAALHMIHPDDLLDVQTAYARLERTSDSAVEYRQRTKSGEYRWLSNHLSITRDSAGRPLYRNGNIRDITERKKIQGALRRSEAGFRLLSETAERLIMWKDVKTVISDLCIKTMAHLDCQVFFNYHVIEEAGRLHLNAFAGITDNEAKKIEWLDYGESISGCSARDKAPVVVENIQAMNDSQVEWVKIQGIQAHACFPLMIQNKVIGTLAFGTRTRSFFSNEDIVLMKRVADQVATATERTRLIDELQQSRDELELRVQKRTADLEKVNEALKRSNVALEDFAHVASHDLQEPLRKIRTFGERLATVEMSSMSELELDYLARMQQAAARMQTLIQELLKYSRVTSNQEHFKFINLRKPAEEAIRDLNLLMEESGGSVEIDELPEVEANANQMRQLFQNLISNSLKYRSDKKKPLIRISTGHSTEEGFHEIHIEDNGIGFDEIYVDKIFKPFQRLHGKSSQYPGTGMGLAICRKIVEIHDGSITAKSEPDKGSTFIVRLPKKHIT